MSGRVGLAAPATGAGDLPEGAGSCPAQQEAAAGVSHDSIERIAFGGEEDCGLLADSRVQRPASDGVIPVRRRDPVAARVENDSNRNPRVTSLDPDVTKKHLIGLRLHVGGQNRQSPVPFHALQQVVDLDGGVSVAPVLHFRALAAGLSTVGSPPPPPGWGWDVEHELGWRDGTGDGARTTALLCGNPRRGGS